jgi:two-component system CheB/CheR fusion protein
VRSANEAFLKRFGLGREAVEDKLLSKIGKGEWNIPRLSELLGQMLTKGGRVADVTVSQPLLGKNRRKLVINGAGIESDRGHFILLAIEESSEGS